MNKAAPPPTTTRKGHGHPHDGWASQNAGVHRFVSIGAAMCLLGGKRSLDPAAKAAILRLRGHPICRPSRTRRQPARLRHLRHPARLGMGPRRPQLDAIAAATRAGKMMLVDRGDTLSSRPMWTTSPTRSPSPYATPTPAGRPSTSSTTTSPPSANSSPSYSSPAACPPDRSIPYPVARMIANTLGLRGGGCDAPAHHPSPACWSNSTGDRSSSMTAKLAPIHYQPVTSAMKELVGCIGHQRQDR